MQIIGFIGGIALKTYLIRTLIYNKFLIDFVYWISPTPFIELYG